MSVNMHKGVDMKCGACGDAVTHDASDDTWVGSDGEVTCPESDRPHGPVVPDEDTRAVDPRLLAVPGHAVSTSYGREELRVNDRELYGHTSHDDRNVIREVVYRARYFGTDAERRAAVEAGTYGRVAYAYACGWYDLLKRSETDVHKLQRVLDACWIFGEEAEYVDYMHRMGASVGRYGFGLAWEMHLRALDLMPPLA